jgi:hypothetical protein
MSEQENAVIEMPVPAAHTAEAWNDAMRTTAEKEGLEFPGAKKPEADAAAAKKEGDQPTVYETTVPINGKDMTFRGADPAAVLLQVTAAVTAAQTAAPVAAAAVDARVGDKRGPSEAELFDIGLKLQKGDVTGINDYLLKSDVIGQYLQAQGVDVAKLKAATEKTQSDSVHDAWTTATNQFLEKVKAGEVDYPGGAANMKMMGITLAQLGLKPSVESMVTAYEHMKKEGLVFPVAAADGKEQPAAQAAPIKTAPSSTAIGTSGTDKGGGAPPAIDPKRRFEIDMTKLSVQQASQSYNELILAGVKPDQIVVKQ